MRPQYGLGYTTEAVRLVMEALEKMPQGNLIEPVGALREGASAFGLVEGWRGPVWHWVVAGQNNSLARVKDPSFANWTALNYSKILTVCLASPQGSKSMPY